MRYAVPSTQMPLLEVPPRYVIERNGQARNAYGSAAQEIVCRALGLDPVPINGNCEVCFDAHCAGIDFEIKSCHAGSKVVCYDWRLAKEERAQVEDGRRVFYAVLCHRVRGERDSSKLFEAMTTDARIFIVSAGEIRLYARQEPLQRMKFLGDPEDKKASRIGYNRKGYLDGYRNLPVKRLESICQQWREVLFSLYGREYRLPVLSA